MMKRKSDIILKKKKDVIESMSDEVKDLWKLAKAKKLWLTGEPVKYEGREVDFSQFDFVFYHTVFDDLLKNPDTHPSKYFQRFWAELYPYVENLLYFLNRYEQQFKDMVDMEGSTLKSYALQNLELQCYQKFFKEELHKYSGKADKIKEIFKIYHEAWESESQEKIKEIKAKEEEHIKRQEEAAKKQEELERQEALRAKLSL